MLQRNNKSLAQIYVGHYFPALIEVKQSVNKMKNP